MMPSARPGSLFEEDQAHASASMRRPSPLTRPANLSMSMPGVGFDSYERASDSVLLHNSVKSNEQHLVSSTIDRGADVNFISCEEAVNVQTPLRAACSQANVRVIRTLLESGAGVHAHFEADRWTALHSAAHAGHDHIVRLLLVEVEDFHENAWHDGFHLLHLLGECLNGRLKHGPDLFVWALRHMPSMDIDARSKRLGYPDWTPLHVVCARGWSKVALVLLRNNAQVSAITGDFYMRSPSVNVFAQGSSDSGAQVASLEPALEQEGAHWLDSGLLPIHLAALGGHLRTVQLLLKSGNSINALTARHKWTPLMFAVWSGNVELVSEICRQGGRKVVNLKDRRADGTEWTPLAIAVARWGPDMIKTLITYNADPLARLGSADFPGQAFLDHVSPLLLDAADNQWSGPDSRISLLHLAVLRGNVRILQTVLPLIGGTPSKKPAAQVMDKDSDLVVSCTADGWSPAVLAVMLHTVDPLRQVPIELLEAFPDPDRGDNTRADVFLELLSTGRSLLEDRPEASPPVMPQRFHDVSETLVCRVVDEFVRLCKATGAERVVTASRISHATLCVACRFNRLQVVKHLLDSGLCDPRCRFLKPVECRPLHIATACGFGYLAQMLLENKADPLEGDENAELPVFKLTRYYCRQISGLQARVGELEAQLAEARASKRPLSDGYESYSRCVSIPGSPSLTTNIGAMLYDSTMSSRM